MVSIGYIPRAVIRCNLERDILTFFDIMVYICDRFVFYAIFGIRLWELVESLLSFGSAQDPLRRRIDSSALASESFFEQLANRVLPLPVSLETTGKFHNYPMA